MPDGGFFCQACLTDKPLDDISPDPRYCLGCYEFLAKEAEILPGGKRPKWMPQKPTGAKIVPKVLYQRAEYGAGIMATVEDEKSEVAIIPPAGAKVAREKRGPKHRDLPEGLIRQLAGEGMGYKRIAARLKAEYSIEVGFRTVARVIKGERLLI